jgi:type IV pilus assembly protein PilO
MNSGFRKVIFLVLLLGFLAAGYQFLIKKANDQLAQARQQLDEKRAKLTEYERITAQAEDYARQGKQVEEAIRFFESKLPPTSEIHKVLEQVTVIAQKQGLDPKTIRTLVAKDTSGYVEQPLQMKLVGNFNSFYSFLLEMEKLPRITKLRELKVQKEKGGEGLISAEFIVSIFFQNKTT